MESKGKFVEFDGENTNGSSITFNDDGSIGIVGGKLTFGNDKSLFDVLIDKIDRDIRVNELSVARDNIEVYLKFMKDSKWGDWKVNRINHAKRLSNVHEQLTSSKIIELIELGYSRQVLKIDEIVKSLEVLITKLIYTKKYTNLSTIIIDKSETGKHITDSLIKYSLIKLPYNSPRSPLRKSFRVEDSAIVDFKSLIENGAIINLSDTSSDYRVEGNYRAIGKTTSLLKLCHKNNATLVVGNHASKVGADNIVKNLGFHVPVRYVSSGHNIDFDKFYMDTGTSAESLRWILESNSKCLGGFANHDSFKVNRRGEYY